MLGAPGTEDESAGSGVAKCAGVAVAALVVGVLGCDVLAMLLVVLAASQPASSRAHTNPITAITWVNGCLVNMA